MLTLHQATDETKTLAKWAILVLVIVLLLFIFVKIGLAIKETYYPSPKAAPTVSFGKLPPLAFPPNKTEQTLSYTIDTLTGKLPTFPDRTNVFKLEQPSPSLLALDQTKTLVTHAGFTNNMTSLSETSYQWQSDGPLVRTLTYDIVSKNFDLSSEYLVDDTTLKAVNLPNEETAIVTSQKFLSSINALRDAIDITQTKTTLLSIVGKDQVAATSLSNAQLIRVDFYQKKMNELPLMYPNPPQSLIYTLVGGGERDGTVVEASDYTKAILTDVGADPTATASATYPIKTAEQAFDELKNGKAYIANYFGSDNQVSIKDVSLAYYADRTQQGYLLPIIVFSGDNGFYAYVLALTDEWINR